MTVFSNWAGNVRFSPAEILEPATAENCVETLRELIRQKRRIRILGGNHSFSPLLETDGALVDLGSLSGIIAVDHDARTVTVAGGTRLADIGAELWRHGYSLANQGDIDVQTVAGAIATGTKGSSAFTGSLSASVRAMTILNGTGEVVEIDARTPDLLAAARVSLGLLGVVLAVTLDVVPAYWLRERIFAAPMEDILKDQARLSREHHHFSYWWMPQDASHEMYALPPTPKGHCLVKILDKVEEGTAAGPGERVGEGWRIYPDGTTEAKFHEMEYMVPEASAAGIIVTLRDRMQSAFPHEISPLQVRWQGPDDGMISPQSGRDTISLSLSGRIGTDYVPFLRAAHSVMMEHLGRAHWGKIHFMSRADVDRVYPRAGDFRAIRRAMDPDGLFLNGHLAEFFA